MSMASIPALFSKLWGSLRAMYRHICLMSSTLSQWQPFSKLYRLVFSVWISNNNNKKSKTLGPNWVLIVALWLTMLWLAPLSTLQFPTTFVQRGPEDFSASSIATKGDIVHNCIIEKQTWCNRGSGASAFSPYTTSLMFHFCPEIACSFSSSLAIFFPLFYCWAEKNCPTLFRFVSIMGPPVLSGSDQPSFCLI